MMMDIKQNLNRCEMLRVLSLREIEKVDKENSLGSIRIASTQRSIRGQGVA